MAANEPLVTPVNDWIGCVWQADGQWKRTAFQLKADGGRVPSWASVEEPEKLMTSPTFQVKEGLGVTMVAVGGVFPAEIVIGLLTVEAPLLSVTFSLTV